MDEAVALIESGMLDDARKALVDVAGALEPVEATAVLRLAEALATTEGDDRIAVAAAIALHHVGRTPQAVEALTEAAEASEGGPVLLAFASHLADMAGDERGALVLRERLVADHGEHPASAAALLDVARYRLEHADTYAAQFEETALQIEDLILAHPTHPLVPTARRVLARLRASAGVKP